MAFTKQLPEWNAIGVEPPQSLKEGGWKAGVKPPADYFNWLQNKAFKAIEELQLKAGEIKTINGQLPDEKGNITISVDTSNFATKEELKAKYSKPTNGIPKSDLASDVQMSLTKADGSAKQTDLEAVDKKIVEHQADSLAHGIGDKSALKTTAKDSLVSAINEAFQFANDGKKSIANAVNAMGVSASPTDTFSTLATKVGQINTSNISRVQRGVSTLSDGTSSINVPISPVAIDKTIVKVTVRTPSINTSEFGSFYIRAVIQNSTTLVLDRNGSSFPAVEVAWEVIEFKNTIIQSGKSAITNSVTSLNVPITSVNMAKAVLFFSYQVNSSAPVNSSSLVSGRLTSATNINFTAGITVSTINIAWYLVEFK